jgi:VanZ family protein
MWCIGGYPFRGAAGRILLAFVGLVLYAAIDELTQPAFGRDSELYDWLADSGGAALGLATAALIAGRLR